MQERALHIQTTAPPRLTKRQKQIRRICEAIASEFHPEKIILFGSHAYGQPRPDSDVDLLIVMPFEGSPFRQASRILGHIVQTVGVLPMDLLVRTSEQVRERLRLGDRFMHEIIERGKVMYETDLAINRPGISAAPTGRNRRGPENRP